MALTFGPLFGLARDDILHFVTLEDMLIQRFVESCGDSVPVIEGQL